MTKEPTKEMIAVGADRIYEMSNILLAGPEGVQDVAAAVYIAMEQLRLEKMQARLSELRSGG